MQGVFHHLDLTVSDPVAAYPLYELFLAHAGFVLEAKSDNKSTWGHQGRLFPSIAIIRSRGDHADRAHDRYSPGLHHFALAASSREDVDDLHAKLVAFGAQILDPPTDYPEFGRGYYAVFFSDPDGLKLEYAFTPDPQENLKDRR